MKREEAIRHIRDLIAENNSIAPNMTVFEEEKEALYMAIEALSAEASQNFAEPNKGLKGSDLISRRDAIRWVKTECNPYGKPTLDFESGKKVIEHLEQMPSAEPKTGEWVEEDEYGDLWVCDQCGFASEYKDNFCPNCGADMRREESEEDYDYERAVDQTEHDIVYEPTYNSEDGCM